MTSANDARVVSVIVPTYNRADSVRRAVDSALNQTYPAMEVVIVDDGSTDDTQAIIEQSYGGMPNVKYIRVANGGVSRARNIGIRAASGEFVAFLDSDDYWLSWKVELQVKCLDLVPHAGMVWSDMDALYDDGTLAQRRYLRTFYSAYDTLEKLRVPIFTSSRRLSAATLGIPGLTEDVQLSDGEIFSQMFVGNLVHTSTCLLRRERMQKVVGFREDLHRTGEDYDFHFRTCREGPVAFADIQTIGYTVGRSDRLTAPSLARFMAQNALLTIESILAESGHLIRLPRSVVRTTLADTHAWVASTSLADGRRREARLHAAKSIRYAPLHAGPYKVLIASLLPEGVVATVRAWRRAKRPGTEQPGSAG